MSRDEPTTDGRGPPAATPPPELTGATGLGSGRQGGPGRRGLLLGALAAGLAAAAAIGIARGRGDPLAYRGLPGLDPFRELVSNGSISASSLAFAGLQGDPSDDEPRIEGRVALVRADLCSALFGAAGDADVVPIAYFSDFNCPYCRVLEGELDAVLAGDPDVRLVRHELPLLGAASLSAAKAVLAADLQGGYEAMKERLLRAGLITDAPYLRAVAGPLGLDADRLLADMEGAAVADRLLTSRALGQVFGFVGTPALVIGRTVVIGSISADTIRQVIRDERATPGTSCATRS